MTSEQAGLAPFFTLALWLTCLSGGTAGLMLPYPREHPPATEPPPVVAQTTNVEVTKELLPPPVAGGSSLPRLPQIAAPAPPPRAAAPTDAPPLEAIATSLPEVAFARPVERPSPPPDATRSLTADDAPRPPTPAVQHITYGQGEGRQPAPEYPREAAVDRQEGTVVILFHVGEDGSVLDADAVSPCPWPLLNQAALRAVRETWRFVTGPARAYEVSIQFQLRRY
jgi:periplasmic protein TonB